MQETEKYNSRFWDYDILPPAFWSKTFSVFRLTELTQCDLLWNGLMSLGGLVTSNGSQIYKHSIKQAVVGLIPLKFEIAFEMLLEERKPGSDKKRTIRNDIFQVIYAMRMICQVGEKQCSNELILTPWKVDLVVQPQSPLEFPGPLTPPPPGISISLRGGGLDIFWNHAMVKKLCATWAFLISIFFLL